MLWREGPHESARRLGKGRSRRSGVINLGRGVHLCYLEPPLCSDRGRGCPSVEKRVLWERGYLFSLILGTGLGDSSSRFSKKRQGLGDGMGLATLFTKSSGVCEGVRA